MEISFIQTIFCFINEKVQRLLIYLECAFKNNIVKIPHLNIGSKESKYDPSPVMAIGLSILHCGLQIRWRHSLSVLISRKNIVLTFFSAKMFHKNSSVRQSCAPMSYHDNPICLQLWILTIIKCHFPSKDVSLF